MFTKRELQVLELIAKGLTTRAIADSLCVARETIKTHKKKIRQKFLDAGYERVSLLELAIRYDAERKNPP